MAKLSAWQCPKQRNVLCALYLLAGDGAVQMLQSNGTAFRSQWWVSQLRRDRVAVACGQTAHGVTSACTPSTAALASPCGTVSSTFSPSFGPFSACLMAACHHLKPFASRRPCHAAASSSGSRCCLCRCRWRYCTHTTGSTMPSVRRPSKHVACGHMYRAISCRTTTSCEPASAALLLLCRPRRAIRRPGAPFCTKVGAELSTILLLRCL
jgi:hypothetical protein